MLGQGKSSSNMPWEGICDRCSQEGTCLVGVTFSDVSLVLHPEPPTKSPIQQKQKKQRQSFSEKPACKPKGNWAVGAQGYTGGSAGAGHVLKKKCAGRVKMLKASQLVRSFQPKSKVESHSISKLHYVVASWWFSTQVKNICQKAFIFPKEGWK